MIALQTYQRLDLCSLFSATHPFSVSELAHALTPSELDLLNDLIESGHTGLITTAHLLARGYDSLVSMELIG